MGELRNVTVREDETCFTIDLDDWTVDAIEMDYAVNVKLRCSDIQEQDRIDIKIETSFALSSPRGSATMIPEDPSTLAPVLSILRMKALRIIARSDGNLLLELDNSTTIHVPPDPSYEAWNVCCRKLLLVGLAGGEVASWGERT
jgi:hypothetical protein